ncbi:MAG: transposase, partial [Gemmobacter sp.]
FTYASGRGGQHAERILQGFGGILQGEEGQQTVRGTVCPTNGYAGYNRLIAPGRIGPGIQLAHCWAHARRKLIEITRTGPAPIAEEGVALIRDLYAIEADIRGSDPATRLTARQERSAPILARLDD